MPSLFFEPLKIEIRHSRGRGGEKIPPEGFCAWNCAEKEKWTRHFPFSTPLAAKYPTEPY